MAIVGVISVSSYADSIKASAMQELMYDSIQSENLQVNVDAVVNKLNANSEINRKLTRSIRWFNYPIWFSYALMYTATYQLCGNLAAILALTHIVRTVWYASVAFDYRLIVEK